jgi:ribosomal protein L11 methyltransferase
MTTPETTDARWTRAACTPSTADRSAALIAAMVATGADGVHEDGATLVTHLAPTADVERFLAALRAADPASVIALSPLEPIDWSTKWRDRITAHRLGALTVTPPWLAAGHDSATTIVIEPAMAFGTGEHPTTRGVVRLLQAIPLAGASVADLGAGSAVLAIAAARLGAARVFAIEHDADSIGNAELNVTTNGVADRVAVLEGDAQLLLPLVAPVQVILANIISSVLLELLPLLGASLAPDGVMILSGILREEREMMVSALEAAGWRIDAEDAEEQWWSVRVRR